MFALHAFLPELANQISGLLANVEIDRADTVHLTQSQEDGLAVLLAAYNIATTFSLHNMWTRSKVSMFCDFKAGQIHCHSPNVTYEEKISMFFRVHRGSLQVVMTGPHNMSEGKDLIPLGCSKWNRVEQIGRKDKKYKGLEHMKWWIMERHGGYLMLRNAYTGMYFRVHGGDQGNVIVMGPVHWPDEGDVRKAQFSLRAEADRVPENSLSSWVDSVMNLLPMAQAVL